MWIDRVLEAERGRRLVAVKALSFSEDQMHGHFAAAGGGEGGGDDGSDGGTDPLPVMPAPLIVEGMAQSAGLLVGLTQDFSEKVALAKVSRAEFFREACPGCTLRFEAELSSLDARGASTTGRVAVADHGASGDSSFEPLAEVDLMFSHLDRNVSGLDFPEHNFVFGESFKTLLRSSGVAFADED